MKILIEIDETHWQESTIRRELADANRRQDWIDLVTPFVKYDVTRVVGVVLDGMSPQHSVPVFVTPLEGSRPVEL